VEQVIKILLIGWALIEIAIAIERIKNNIFFIEFIL
jgi:hypothetical protein